MSVTGKSINKELTAVGNTCNV